MCKSGCTEGDINKEGIFNYWFKEDQDEQIKDTLNDTFCKSLTLFTAFSAFIMIYTLYLKV